MDLLYQLAFAKALGWSLIDSLWQMGTIWFFYLVITANGTKFSAYKRHTLALLGATSGTLVFFLSIAVNYYSAANNSSFFSLAYFIDKHAGEMVTGYVFEEKIIPAITVLYLPALLFFSLRLMFEVNSNKNVYRRNLIAPEKAIIDFVQEMSEKAGIIKKVSVWISGKAECPLTIGFWKPVILLPVAVFSHLSCRQVEAVIMHELFHIRRNDYLVNVFLTVAEVILFFNPFARMLFGIIKKERENSCDDHVITSGFDAWEYSQALYLLGRYRYNHTNLAIAATGTGKEYLLQRIRRMMNRRNPSPSIVKPLISFFLCLFLAGIAGRQKNIPVLADIPAKNEIGPVVYFSEEKEIKVKEPEKILRIRRQVQTVKPEEIILPPEAPPPPEESEINEHSDEDNEEILNVYIAAPEVLEFTIIDRVQPDVPKVIRETPQPFIQKSSFYYTEIDTIAGRKVVDL